MTSKPTRSDPIIHEVFPKKPNKVLTNVIQLSKINSVKDQMKGRHMASTKKTKTTRLQNVSAFIKNANWNRVARTSAWLLETAFRVSVGITMLAKFDGFLTTAVALYALGTAAVIVMATFFKATNREDV